MEYKLNKAQMKFMRATAKEVAIVSGLGGGKSFALQMWCLSQCLTYPDALHCYVSLSYRNMKDSSIPEFTARLEECEIPFEYLASESAFIINGKTKVIFRSQDAADKLRSVEIGSLAADELAYWKKASYFTTLGRLRDKSGSCQARSATTPKGKNWFYKHFVGKASDNRQIIRTSTYDNKHLQEDYIQLLKDSYDSHLLRQELEGEFASTDDARTYYMYSSNCLDLTAIDTRLPVVVGMDFNVNPMSAVILQRQGDTIYALAELYLRNSNTHAMAVELRALLRKLGHNAQVSVIPDSTGANRHTSSTRTDHDILREAGFHVPPFRNPRRKDRFNHVNNLLDKGLFKVSALCANLITDFESFADDEEVSGLGHISDACGYALCHMESLVKRADLGKARQL